MNQAALLKACPYHTTNSRHPLLLPDNSIASAVPTMSPSLIDLDGRANIGHTTVEIEGSSKAVLVYEDHRYFLNILDHAMRCGVVDRASGITLVMLDRHDDAKPHVGLDRLIRAFRASWPRQQRFWSFVEWRLSALDDDWVRVGMDLGMIKNFVVIGANENDNVHRMSGGTRSGHYVDPFGGKHLIASVGHIWNGLGHQGWLVDKSNSSELQPIWDVLGWNGTHFDQNPDVPVVLDICLDCFSYSGPPDRDSRAWRCSDFFEPFERDIHGRSAASFVTHLATQSPFIGIARESPYCGGYGDSDTILRYIDLLFFRGQLRPSSYGR